MMWIQLSEFKRYSVSSTGLIRHDEHDRILKQFSNNLGFVYVCLYKDNRNLKRGVARLVAEHHMQPHPRAAFDTPINLDGDRANNDVRNLMWRPRWFAVQYHQQFEEELASYHPVMEVDTGAYFADALVAAANYGLLSHKIIQAATKGEPVWPTLQKFQFVR